MESIRSKAIAENEHHPVGLVVLAAIICLILTFSFLYIQNVVLPPPNALVAGPLYHNAITIVAVAILLLYLGAIAALVQGRPSLNLYLAYFNKLFQKPVRYLTIAILTVVALGVSFQTSSYWYATADGLTIHPGWSRFTITHPWSEVAKVFFSCNRHRGAPIVGLRAELRMGKTFDVTGSSVRAFITHLPQLVELTKRAELYVPGRGCPSFLTEALKMRY